MPAGSFAFRVARRILRFEPPPSFKAVVDQKVFGDEGAEPILLELPETEFLTVIENALKIAFDNGRLRAVAELTRTPAKHCPRTERPTALRETSGASNGWVIPSSTSWRFSRRCLRSQTRGWRPGATSSSTRCVRV